MRLADYVMNFLEEQRVKHIFLLSGGGIMYLADAVGRSKIEYVCCHHEQAAGIAAQAYAMTGNSLGVCMVTTGPGGTNALTAAGAAYMDSTPVLFISGQVKTADFASLRSVRQFGAQENDIIAMAKPVTKYAVTVMEPKDIRYHLEKAVYLALHGRRGPVWLDIPLDIQNAQIDPDQLVQFDLTEVSGFRDVAAEKIPDAEEVARIVDSTYQMLLEARRPLFLVGHGVVAAEAQTLFREIQEELKIPVEATWRALDVMDCDSPYFYGSPGLQAPRYSNLILQSADLLIILGSRLDNMITAFSEEHFAFRAKKIIIDIDYAEPKKLQMPDIIAAICSVDYFLRILRNKICDKVFPDYTTWMRFCQKLKETYPLLKEKQPVLICGVDLYRMSTYLSECCTEQDVIVVSSTSRCNTAGHIAFKHRAGQRTISSMGFGSMGFVTPSILGAWFASGGKRVIALEGDGSLQLNLQELQTIVHYRINAKIFVFSNAGYAAISTMQDRNFEGFHVGCDANSGVSMPDLGKLAAAYGIPFFRIQQDNEISCMLKAALETDGPVICEFAGDIAFDEIPKCISYEGASGRRVSAALENQFPFLPADEMRDLFDELGEK